MNDYLHNLWIQIHTFAKWSYNPFRNDMMVGEWGECKQSGETMSLWNVMIYCDRVDDLLYVYWNVILVWHSE